MSALIINNLQSCANLHPESQNVYLAYAAVQSIYKESPLQIKNKVDSRCSRSRGCFTNIRLNSSSQELFTHDSVLEKHKHIDPKANFRIL